MALGDRDDFALLIDCELILAGSKRLIPFAVEISDVLLLGRRGWRRRLALSPSGR